MFCPLAGTCGGPILVPDRVTNTVTWYLFMFQLPHCLLVLLSLISSYFVMAATYLAPVLLSLVKSLFNLTVFNLFRIIQPWILSCFLGKILAPHCLILFCVKFLTCLALVWEDCLRQIIFCNVYFMEGFQLTKLLIGMLHHSVNVFVLIYARIAVLGKLFYHQ